MINFGNLTRPMIRVHDHITYAILRRLVFFLIKFIYDHEIMVFYVFLPLNQYWQFFKSGRCEIWHLDSRKCHVVLIFCKSCTQFKFFASHVGNSVHKLIYFTILFNLFICLIKWHLIKWLNNTVNIRFINLFHRTRYFYNK